jgi:hypothetical protein
VTQGRPGKLNQQRKSGEAMFRRLWILGALCAAIGCSGSSAEPGKAASPELFAGAWRSVTPSLEFIRLSVNSKSSEIGMMATRLTFSGVAWEGSGRIVGDSLLMNMTVLGTSAPIGVFVARATDARTLRVQVRPASAGALDLTLVRED